MSSRCQCPFSGPADTILGSHRDPVSSEKGWLDYAVRELSRVAAGKARGQEAVWRSQCKPVWWDSECDHPWKNPTANPKDSKDTLKAKFECLVQHLRKQGQLPGEMAEEITLWEAERKSEVFLMTFFSSLLGQASNLHCILGEAYRKMGDTGISVAPSILTDLQGCLSACVDKLTDIKNIAEQRNNKCEGSKPAKSTSCSGRKRPYDSLDSDTLSEPHSKCSKQPCNSPASSVSSLFSPPSSASCSTSPKPVQSVSTPFASPEQQQALLTILKEKLAAKHRVAAVAVPACSVPRGNRKTPHTVQPKQVGQTKAVPTLGQTNAVTAAAVDSSSTVCVPATVSECLPPEKLVDTEELPDFLQLDLIDSDDGPDGNFIDDFLRENSPCLISDSTPNTEVTSVSQNSVSCATAQTCSEMSSSVNSPVHSRSHISMDPFLGHAISEDEPFHFSTESETVAGRQLDGEDGTTEFFGTALCSDVRDVALSDTEVASDSGYHSESPGTSHRSSLDSDMYSHSDLNSPDLEAYLASLWISSDCSTFTEIELEMKVAANKVNYLRSLYHFLHVFS